MLKGLVQSMAILAQLTPRVDIAIADTARMLAGP